MRSDTLFLDSAYAIALAAPDDESHAKAAALATELRSRNLQMLTTEAVVFEIGPGTGMLTRELLELVGKVIALEADHELFDKLQTDFASEIAEGRLELIHGDIRTFDITALPKGYALVANIPYYITGHLLRVISELAAKPERCIFMVQAEVAQRIIAEPPRKPVTLGVFFTKCQLSSVMSISTSTYPG